MKTDNYRIVKAERYVWVIAVILIIAGIFIIPMNLRYSYFKAKTSFRYAGSVNLLLTAVLLMLVAVRRRYSLLDIVLSVIWSLMIIPVLASNIENDIDPTRTAAALINVWLPLFMLYQHIGKECRRQIIHAFVVIYDVIGAFFLCAALYEKFTGGSALAWLTDLFAKHGFKVRDFALYQTFMSSSPFRFCSLWGHALTMAVFFNAFFILNDIYYKSVKKRYPKLIFFIAALTGILLCAGKTAIVVLFAYLVVSNWKHKKWFLVYAAALVFMYFSGLFQSIIDRFQNGSLTSGRIDALKLYFSTDLYRLKIWTGYGTGTAYVKEMVLRKPAFEFPFLMSALDYGIIFSALLYGTVFFYYTWQCLKRKNISAWFGISLFFLQVCTYNGMAQYNQDVAWFVMIFIMLSVNCVEMAEDTADDDVKPVHGLKGTLIHIICCE